MEREEKPGAPTMSSDQHAAGQVEKLSAGTGLPAWADPSVGKGEAPGGPEERNRLRRFGLVVGGAFLVLSGLLLWKQRPAWPLFLAAGGLLAAAGLLTPLWLRGVERIWMRVAGAMGWVMTRVILGLVFALVFTPAGLIMKLTGADPLRLRFEPGARTYWQKRTRRRTSREDLERMF